MAKVNTTTSQNETAIDIDDVVPTHDWPTRADYEHALNALADAYNEIEAIKYRFNAIVSIYMTEVDELRLPWVEAEDVADLYWLVDCLETEVATIGGEREQLAAQLREISTRLSEQTIAERNRRQDAMVADA
jgi:hypothetical protein